MVGDAGKGDSTMTTKHYSIDYGHGRADLWSDCGENSVEQRFMKLANQCFGIRKSIGDFTLLESFEEAIPKPWADLPGTAEMLKHNGDTIVWNDDGEKIKSEWD